MNVAEAYKALRLKQGAGLAEVKSAYRSMAFELHPDLNPDNPHAARMFQRVNEAYVLLKDVAADTPKQEQRESRAERAWSKTRSGGNGSAAGQQSQAGASSSGPTASSQTASGATASGQASSGKSSTTRTSTGTSSAKSSSRFSFKKEEVLQDILKDPFARQVFEDIYSQIRRTGSSGLPARKARRKRRFSLEWGDSKVDIDLSKGVVGGTKSWLRGMLDDHQVMYLAPSGLRPGGKVRLQVQRGLGGRTMAVEVNLPADFEVGKPIRLKGLGRKLGPWQGDLYLTLLAKAG